MSLYFTHIFLAEIILRSTSAFKSTGQLNWRQIERKLRDLRHTIRELSVKLQKKIEKFPPRDSILFFFFFGPERKFGRDNRRWSSFSPWDMATFQFLFPLDPLLPTRPRFRLLPILAGINYRLKLEEVV